MSGPNCAATTSRLCLIGFGECKFSFVAASGSPTSVTFSTRKIESLLAYLILHPSPHPREQLAALFWGDSTDDDARRSLRVALSGLRKAFEGLQTELFVGGRDSLQLNPELQVESDVLEFQRLMDLPSPSPTDLQRATDLHKGLFLPGFYDDWVLRLRDELQDLCVAALLMLAKQQRKQGAHGPAQALARRVLAYDRANEAAYQHLIASLAESGDRSSALQQFEQCKQALHEELNLPPSAETLALAEMVKKTMQAAAQPAPPQPKVVSPVLPSGPSTTTTMPPTNLPRSLTSFVGRVSALAEVKHLLTSLSLPPLVSVVGAGGSGKTRLAQQVGRELLPAYADGVWWIELAPLADTALMPQAIAKVLNVRAQNGADILDTLLSHMANKRMLLILDNCEHLILGCARLVERLLAQCERLQVLVTSREPLAIAGEGVWRIPLLGVPSATQRQIQSSPSQPSALSGLITNECVALFVARAQAAKSDFALTERSAAAIVQICRRLDGIPLAIELAASRVRAMSAEQIAARLDDKFNLLTGGSRTALPRQQTLQALIDWSYDLLSANEQRLFRALSVFRGGFSIAAVEACGFGDLDTFLRLVDKSLVNLDTTRDEARYFILETVREYAQKLFEQFDEVAAVKARLVAWCVQKVQQAELHLRGQNAAQHFAWYDQERDNLRAAIEYAHQTDLAAAYKLVSGHHMFWASHGYWDEGAAESSRLLSRWNASQMPEYAHLLYNLAVFWVRKMTNTAQAIQDLQHVIALTTQYHLPELMAKSHRMLGHIHYTTTHQLDLAKTHLLIALDLHRSIGNQAGVSAALDGLSDVARFSGAFDEALAYLHESLSIDEARGDVRDIASAHLGLGFTYLSKGDSMQGKYHLKLTYRYLQKIQVVRYYRNVLSGFLRAYVLEKDFLRAAQVKGGYDKLCETESSLIYGDDLLQFNLACEQIKIALPENVYQQAYNEGYAYMTASSDTIDYFL